MTNNGDRIQPGEFYRIQTDGKWDIFLDATMCGVFGACPQMFKYSFVDCLTPKGERPFVRELGSWWSRLMEVIYTRFADGKPILLSDVPGAAMQLWDELNMEELNKTEPKKYKEFGGRYGALTMIADYASRQLPIDYQTWKIIAAEASFGRNKEILIGETDLIRLYWMGQPDLYVLSAGRLMPVDHKSLSAIDSMTHRKYKPHIQIPGYIIAGQVLAKSLGIEATIDRAIVNCVARTDRTDKTGEAKYPRFKRITVPYNTDELEEWRTKRLKQAEELRRCFETGVWDWHELTCNSFFFRMCPFHNIDEKTPNVRPIVIAADYIKRNPWIPGRTEKELKEKGEGE